MDNVMAGQLNQQITLRQQTGTATDEAGALIVAETDTGPIWAKVEFRKAGSEERFSGDQVTAVTAVNFTIRNHPSRTVSTQDKIIYRGLIYEISSVIEADAKRCFLLLETKQIGEYNTA